MNRLIHAAYCEHTIPHTEAHGEGFRPRYIPDEELVRQGVGGGSHTHDTIHILRAEEPRLTGLATKCKFDFVFTGRCHHALMRSTQPNKILDFVGLPATALGVGLAKRTLATSTL